MPALSGNNLCFFVDSNGLKRITMAAAKKDGPGFSEGGKPGAGA
jgi:hypothetical protein